MAGGTAAKKIKKEKGRRIDPVTVVCPLIKETKFIFLRAAPAGGSGCRSLEPASWPV
ncbi:MAG: hypothetical protein MPK62_04170 [Alphaproteobacteria bacterium]|nr:hypothetical protein [Alphaproteobacteria bacterium]